jgi:hypothetical protein
MVQGRKLTNKKSSQSYGWISKIKVLLWQSAFIKRKAAILLNTSRLSAVKIPC